VHDVNRLVPGEGLSYFDRVVDVSAAESDENVADSLDEAHGFVSPKNRVHVILDECDVWLTRTAPSRLESLFLTGRTLCVQDHENSIP